MAAVDVEPVTAVPTRTVGRTVFTQTWAQLSFLHWAVEPARVQPYLPPGVRPDTVDGLTYVGLVPFLMRDIGALGPALSRPSRRARTSYWPNVHEQWPLYSATLEELAEGEPGVLAAAGFGDLARRSPDSVLFSPGVHARFGPSYPADRRL